MRLLNHHIVQKHMYMMYSQQDILERRCMKSNRQQPVVLQTDRANLQSTARKLESMDKSFRKISHFLPEAKKPVFTVLSDDLLE